MIITFIPSLSYSKYLEIVCTMKKSAIKPNTTIKNVNNGLDVKWLKALNTVAKRIANTISIKYTEIMTFLTLELLVLIDFFYDIEFNFKVIDDKFLSVWCVFAHVKFE